jgi:hypothetical protein
LCPFGPVKTQISSRSNYLRAEPGIIWGKIFGCLGVSFSKTHNNTGIGHNTIETKNGLMDIWVLSNCDLEDAGLLHIYAFTTQSPILYVCVRWRFVLLKSIVSFSPHRVLSRLKSLAAFRSLDLAGSVATRGDDSAARHGIGSQHLGGDARRAGRTRLDSVHECTCACRLCGRAFRRPQTH